MTFRDYTWVEESYWLIFFSSILSVTQNTCQPAPTASQKLKRWEPSQRVDGLWNWIITILETHDWDIKRPLMLAGNKEILCTPLTPGAADECEYALEGWGFSLSGVFYSLGRVQHCQKYMSHGFMWIYLPVEVQRNQQRKLLVMKCYLSVQEDGEFSVSLGSCWFW